MGGKISFVAHDNVKTGCTSFNSLYFREFYWVGPDDHIIGWWQNTKMVPVRLFGFYYSSIFKWYSTIYWVFELGSRHFGPDDIFSKKIAVCDLVIILKNRNKSKWMEHSVFKLYESAHVRTFDPKSYVTSTDWLLISSERRK